MKGSVKLVLCCFLFNTYLFSAPTVLLSEEAKANNVEVKDEQKQVKIASVSNSSQKATPWWALQTKDNGEHSLSPKKVLKPLSEKELKPLKEEIVKKEEKNDVTIKEKNITKNPPWWLLQTGNNTNSSLVPTKTLKPQIEDKDKKKTLVSIELKEKIDKEKAKEKAKLEKLAKDTYTDESTLDNIESIDSTKIANSDNIGKFKEETKVDVSVDLNINKTNKVKKQDDPNASVDDFFDKKNKSIAVSNKQEEKLAPIVME